MDRSLPADLAAVLNRARAVERAAGTRAQLLDAVRATTILALAAQRAGWATSEIAAGLGMQHKALTKRLQRYRADRDVGLIVTPAPPGRISPPLPPLEQREWLTRAEAVELAGISESGIDRWAVAFDAAERTAQVRAQRHRARAGRRPARRTRGAPGGVTGAARGAATRGTARE